MGWGDVVQVVVPEECRQSLVQLAHEGPLAGHFGVKKTVQWLRKNFWWPRMTIQVAAYIKECNTCQVCHMDTATVMPLFKKGWLLTPLTRREVSRLAREEVIMR